MYKLNKPYNNTQKYDFIITYNHNLGLKIEETEDALYALEPHEIMVDNEVIINENYDNEKLSQLQNNLKEEFNYSLKEKVAYTGVIFDYENQELYFETNKNSIGLINFTLTSLMMNPNKEVKNWKCRKTIEPYEPYNVNFTKDQFIKLVNFAGLMVNKAFEIEAQINNQIEQLTLEEIQDTEFLEEFKNQIKDLYNSIPIKMEDLFKEE